MHWLHMRLEWEVVVCNVQRRDCFPFKAQWVSSKESCISLIYSQAHMRLDSKSWKTIRLCALPHTRTSLFRPIGSLSLHPLKIKKWIPSKQSLDLIGRGYCQSRSSWGGSEASNVLMPGWHRSPHWRDKRQPAVWHSSVWSCHDQPALP